MVFRTRCPWTRATCPLEKGKPRCRHPEGRPSGHRGREVLLQARAAERPPGASPADSRSWLVLRRMIWEQGPVSGSIQAEGLVTATHRLWWPPFKEMYEQCPLFSWRHCFGKLECCFQPCLFQCVGSCRFETSKFPLLFYFKRFDALTHRVILCL